jgi:two-component system sensor histidine kinase KdpD
MLADQAQRLARLIDQLLDVSRVENEALDLTPRRVRLAEHVRALVDGLPGAADVQLQVPAELEVDADPLALDRVLSNLVANAVRYGEPPVVVSAARVDRHIRVNVLDSGPGVPEDVRGRLFEQFSRGSNSAGRQGAGLSLAIARSYARAHGGDLVYHAEESGARFELILPAELSS